MPSQNSYQFCNRPGNSLGSDLLQPSPRQPFQPIDLGNGAMRRAETDKKRLVEDALRLDAKDLRSFGVLRPGASGSYAWQLLWGRRTVPLAEAKYQTSLTELCLGFSGEGRSFQQMIRVVISDCFFGGQRRWFLCPFRHEDRPCYRRVRCLYLPPNETQFGCRDCHRLTYRSVQQHDHRVELLRRDPVSTFRMLLDDTGSVFAQFGRWKFASKAIAKGFKYSVD